MFLPIRLDAYTDVYVVKKKQALLDLTELFTFTYLIKETMIEHIEN